MATKLPFEVLVTIAEHLSVGDRLVCAQVCSSWNPAFSKTLYHQIVFRKRTAWQQFIDLINRDLGRFVKHVALTAEVPITLEELKRLRNTCRLLQTLTFEPDELNTVSCLTSICRWPRLRWLPALSRMKSIWPLLDLYGLQLTRLELKGYCVDGDAVPAILRRTPNVQHLSLSGISHCVVLKPDDIKRIHSLCPLLLHLTLKHLHLMATDEELNLTASNHMPGLKALNLIDIKLSSDLWIVYLAHKYPGLVEIKLDLVYSQRTRPRSLQPQTAMMVRPNGGAILSVAQECRGLRRLILRNMPTPFQLSTQFFNTFQELKTSLVEVDIGLPDPHRGRDLIMDAALYRSIVESVRDTVSVLRMHQAWRNIQYPSEMINLVVQCRHLTELKLSSMSFMRCLKKPFNVNILLKHLEKLRSLTLFHAKVAISEPLNQKTSHLQYLQMNHCVFNHQLFEQLQLYCPQLTTLIIRDCGWQRPCDNRKLSFHMPALNLDKVEISSLHLLNANQKPLDKAVAILLLTTTNSNGQTIQCHGSYAFYTPPQNVQLSEANIEIIQHYEKENQTGEQIKQDENDGHDRTKLMIASWNKDDLIGDTAFWQDNYYYGYVHFECHSVRHFVWNTEPILM
ncbi:hypothetical protein DFQ28_000035 [Apophysomyces sp. BC1034]|nr:hypothetical protein DFQ30_007809 [Apophysomyces sp. BC1015]KAG0182855.1 hypothetical protein DFQ29_001795 [Apophysomyces sp. BC1021]KAG0194936.1 hypothetical protein DFQ28_000035 [Apophysomyces sp. BC1034]